MGRAMIVSAGANSNEYLSARLSELGYTRPVIVPSGTEARRRMLEADFELVIVNAPLPDEFGHELCAAAVEQTDAGVILLAKAAACDQLLGPMNAQGVLVVGLSDLTTDQGLSSPAQSCGLQPGDVITSVDGVPTPDGAAYAEYLEENPLSDQPVEITYDRNGTEYSVEITPREYRTPGLGFSYNTGYTEAQGLEVLKYAALDVKYMIRTTLLSLKELVTGGLGMDDLSGPVGVVDAIGTAYEETKDEGTVIMWMNLLNMAVLLSANLGVMNLLPLPALDGGRLVFLLLEAVRRRPVNREVEGMVHFAGLMLLMALMVVVMYNDILKIV